MPPTIPTDAIAEYKIWPDGPPENLCAGLTETSFESPDPTTDERWIRNIQTPTLTHFKAVGPAKGAVLVAPGGAFHFVSIDNEGYRMARRLTARGYDAFVLKYRCYPLPETDAEVPAALDTLFGSLPKFGPGDISPPTRHPNAETGRTLAQADGRQALRFLRENAERLGIAANPLGIMGFSAGGGIAAHLAYAAPQDCRPDFAALIYAGYTPQDAPKENDPPTFLAIAADDELIPAFSSARLAEACHRASVPVELHIYQNGGHGFGSRTQGTQSDRWFDDFDAWFNAALPS
jgi:acetyl esterase/lipase